MEIESSPAHFLLQGIHFERNIKTAEKTLTHDSFWRNLKIGGIFSNRISAKALDNRIINHCRNFFKTQS
jgi:hypothetical protein